MRFSTLAVALVFQISVSVSMGQEAGISDAIHGTDGTPATVTTESSLLPILEILDKANLSGSVEFSGPCNSFVRPGFPEFPQASITATSDGSTLQNLRNLFANDKAMRVTQDSDGTIRMREPGVPRDILSVWIDQISFDTGGGGVFNANAALNFILSTPEVKLFMKSHDIKRPYDGNVLMGTIGPPPPTVPHISGSMKNVTVSDALDRTLKTFPGIWIYENCPGNDARQRIVYFQFYRQQNPRNRGVFE